MPSVIVVCAIQNIFHRQGLCAPIVVARLLLHQRGVDHSFGAAVEHTAPFRNAERSLTWNSSWAVSWSASVAC